MIVINILRIQRTHETWKYSLKEVISYTTQKLDILNRPISVKKLNSLLLPLKTKTIKTKHCHKKQWQNKDPGGITVKYISPNIQRRNKAIIKYSFQKCKRNKHFPTPVFQMEKGISRQASQTLKV